jgi:hypothetical protein
MMLTKRQPRTVNVATPTCHVEVVTENGFTIVRACELGFPGSDSFSGCRFIVGMAASGRVRSVKVEFAAAAVAQAQQQRSANPLSRTSSFWLHCAERQLAAYVWENDECPVAGRLRVESLSVEELKTAAQWKQA